MYMIQMQEVDISKLATHYTLSNDDIPTTLVSTARYRPALFTVLYTVRVNC